MGRGTAAAKVILLGEHAVVYGAPALVACLPGGASAEASPAAEPSLERGAEETRLRDGTETARAFAALLAALDAPPARVRARLEVPAGVGLGASAALGVAIARALVALEGDTAARPDATARVLAAANAWEGVFHGNPSGIDAAAAAGEGCLFFTRAEGARPVAPGAPLELAVAIAGAPASTRELVERVAARRREAPAETDHLLERIGLVVSDGLRALQEGDTQTLGELFDEDHSLLSRLGVSTPELDQACRLARDAGALGAKLTGSGGGGCVIALCDGESDGVRAAWQRAGLPSFPASLPSAARERGRGP